MYLAAVGTALPPHFHDQDALIQAFKERWGREHFNIDRVERLHRAVMVGGRHLALPIPEYDGLTFGKANDAFIRVGTDIGEEAVLRALAEAEIDPSEVDAILFTSVTGIATPSIDARLCNRIAFRSDIKRIPIFGLGCVAGAAGISRMHDYLKAYPDRVAVLLSVELCSLTLQQEDLSVANLIASGLFGDGAACVVGVGDQHPKATGPRTVASRSRFYPDTERTMGWDISESGFKIVLDKSVPALAREHLGEDLDAFIEPLGIERAGITSWVCHPGGPAILQAFEQALGITRHDVQLTWDSLQEYGNLSSASVLFILKETLEKRPASPGDLGILLAMGPGFCSELVLLEW